MSPIRNNVIDFERDLADFSRKVELELKVVVKTVVFSLFKKIVLRTPVDTGRAAGNWQVSRGDAGAGTVSATGPEASMARLGGVTFDPPEGVWWIFNNLPYIQVLEFGLYPNPPAHPTGRSVGGFSVQAPQGMVRVSIAEMNAEMEAILRKKGIE